VHGGTAILTPTGVVRKTLCLHLVTGMAYDLRRSGRKSRPLKQIRTLCLVAARLPLYRP
jgi:hypothetical protein